MVKKDHVIFIPHSIHGPGIFTYVKTHQTSTIHVGKYSSPVDGMGTIC